MWFEQCRIEQQLFFLLLTPYFSFDIARVIFGMGVSTASLSWFMPILWLTKTGKSFRMAYCPIDIPHPAFISMTFSIWRMDFTCFSIEIHLIVLCILFQLLESLLNCNSDLLGVPTLHKFLSSTNLISIFSSASLKSLKNTECWRIQGSALYTWQFLPAWHGHIPPILIPSIGSIA